MSSVQTTPIAHSRIGASSMHRWSVCPGSVRMSEGIPNKSSKYAEEGTLAHDIAANALLGKGIPADVDDEMLEAIDVYINAVTDALKACPDCEILVEHKFDLSKIHPGLFGTSDCVIYNPEKSLLQVFDYKHGAGIAVDVEANEQLMYYGLGALISSGYKVKEVELIIVQPRCPHPDGEVRRWKFDSFELLDFAADLKDFAVATEKPDAPLKSGDHCRFCPAAGICPEIHSKALVMAKEEFSPTLSYDPAKLTQVLNWLPALESWIKSVREFAYGEAEHGRCPPGWKLVQKRATRKWRDEKEAEKFILDSLKIDKEDAFSSSLRSPAQIEKLLKKADKEKLASVIVAESSGFTLAPESDKREAAKLDAKSEFTAISNDVEDLLS